MTFARSGLRWRKRRVPGGRAPPHDDGLVLPSNRSARRCRRLKAGVAGQRAHALREGRAPVRTNRCVWIGRRPRHTVKPIAATSAPSRARSPLGGIISEMARRSRPHTITC
jgi:hypothetical protein